MSYGPGLEHEGPEDDQRGCDVRKADAHEADGDEAFLPGLSLVARRGDGGECSGPMNTVPADGDRTIHLLAYWSGMSFVNAAEGTLQPVRYCQLAATNGPLLCAARSRRFSGKG